MGWLTRIKDSLLSKIKKKIPKKDLESVEKTRKEKKEIIIKEETVQKIEVKEEQNIQKKNSGCRAKAYRKEKRSFWFI